MDPLTVRIEEKFIKSIMTFKDVFLEVLNKEDQIVFNLEKQLKLQKN